MIDIHSHVLGEEALATDLAPALALCQRARDDGIDELVVSLRLPADDDEALTRAVEFEGRLSELRHHAPAGLTINGGFEWELNDGLASRVGSLGRQATIASSRYLLVGLPHWSLPPDCNRLLADIRSMGYVPIVSHPECSRALRHAPGAMAGMIEAGALVQVDALSLTGGYGEEIAIFTRQLLEASQAHFIATRASSRTRGEASLKDARDGAGRIVGRQAANCLVWDNPRAVLANSTLTEPRPARRRAPILKAALTYRG
jgi:protein-tyrosine phosphatase